MKTAIWILAIYSMILTSILTCEHMKTGMSLLDHDSLRSEAVWAFGDDWQKLTFDDLVPAWNVQHPDMKVKSTDIIYEDRSFLLKAIEISILAQ